MPPANLNCKRILRASRRRITARSGTTSGLGVDTATLDVRLVPGPGMVTRPSPSTVGPGGRQGSRIGAIRISAEDLIESK